MKKILIAALLGLSTLLPQTQVFGSSFKAMRTVTSTIEGWVFIAHSDSESGTIDKIEIFIINGTVPVAKKKCGGYNCSIDIAGLPAGQYVAKVTTQNTVYISQFVKG
jgi:hypothetical protein